MNKNKLIQYLILILLGITMNYPFIPIGDYCRGLLNVLNLVFFGGAFLLSFTIILIINIHRRIKYKQKFDLIPILIFTFFTFILYGLIKLDYSKFWTKKELIGRITDKNEPTSGTLKLYRNRTFEATLNAADFSCTYVGDYNLIKDTLLLKRKNLENETENLFTTKYLIIKNEQKMRPFNKNFSEIEILDNK